MPTEGSAPFSGLELDTSLGSMTDTDILSYFMNDDTDLLNTYLSTSSSTSTSTSTSASTATSGCSYDASSSSSSSSSSPPSHTDSSPGSSPLHATPQSPLSADGGSTDLEASLESIVKQEPTENSLNLLSRSLLPSFPTIKSESYSQKSVRNFKQEDQKCSNKKRSHSSSDSEDDDSCLSLSRDELLKLTSKGLEAFTQNLSTRGGLTQDEERQLKRQRRLIKNRESAQLSRMRKKIYIEDLERKVTGLTSVNEKLTQQVSALALQNKALRDEVAYLHSVIKQSNPQLPSAAATTAVGVIPQTLPLLAGRGLRQEQVHSALGASRGLKTAGVCLLIVLFSFGLFFNSISRGKGPTPAGMHRYTGRVLQSLPDEVGTPRLPAAAQPDQIRDAIEVFDDEPPKPSTSELLHPAQPAAQPAAQPKLIGEKRALQDTSTPGRNVKKVKIQDDTNLLPATDDKDKEAHSLVSLSQRQQPENPEEDFLRGMNRTDVRGIHWRPNTRYLFCSDPQHVRSPEPISVEHEGSYPAVSFLLPSTAFNGSVSLNGYGENALVEINCQILGINVYPMYSISN